MGIVTPAFAQLNAAFTATPVSGCAPLVVNFQDQSTGGPTGWTWNFGNGSAPSTLQNPSAFYINPGLYTVTLTVTNGITSDTEIKTNYILVYNKPQAGFTMSNDTICVGSQVIFGDASTVSAGAPAITNWAWNFGDGNSATVSTPTVSHTYSTAGTFPVNLGVADPNGCSGNIVKNIVVLPAPALSFSASPTQACTPPLTVNFSNTSSAAGSATYTWSFGDGGTSTANSPSHTYTANGTYTVTLIVSQSGCIDTLIKPAFVIIQPIVASYTASPTSVCTGGQINFTNTSTPSAILATWDFGDGTNSNVLNPSHTYTAAGTYSISMTATDASGCTDTFTGLVTVNQTPTANFIGDTLNSCGYPLTVNFTNQSTGATDYIWDFGDGTPISTALNPSHIYSGPGQYTVTLTAINSAGPCQDSTVKLSYINIIPPVAGFVQPPDSGCIPLTINFSSTSSSPLDPISSYYWDFGDGSTATSATGLISHTYTVAGTYSPVLIITTSAGCTDTIACPGCVKAGIGPTAIFGILDDTVCYNVPVQFSDSSLNATGWMWHFGDGQTSMAQNTTHLYPDTGTYMAYLVVYNNGCTDTAAIQNVVVLPPRADFQYLLNCTNYYSVQFTNTSAGGDSLVWKFGDGTIDSSNNPTPIHVYPARGPYSVWLIAYNLTTGCSDSINQSFTIAEPIASFTTSVLNGCYPLQVSFGSTSQDASGYLWDLGDPSSLADTSVIDSANWIYTNPGNYIAQLIITDVNGCTDTVTDTIFSLGPLPYFFADTLTGCRPLIVTFSDTSISDSVITQWTWNFGDGTPPLVTSTGTVVHTYTNTGVFNVTMTVKDTNGCVKTIIKNSYVQPTFPMPAFSLDTFACKFDSLLFDASATNVIGGTYIWNFGDGTIDTTLNDSIFHAYLSDGVYSVSLTVTDINGCDSTIVDTVLILKPTANFGWVVDSLSCGKMQVSFIDSSQGLPTSWQWWFGNGGTSNQQNPNAIYTSGGVFSVTLAVTNDGGCRDTLVLDSIITVPFAVGDFTVTPASGCTPVKVCFATSATNTSNYVWNFGDGTVISGPQGDTCHTYISPGIYDPQLLLQYTLPGGLNCVEQATNATGSVTVTNVINVALSGQPVINLPLDTIIALNANYNGGVAPYSYLWNPANGLNCDTCSSVLIVGMGDTINYVFTIYDSAGCIGKDSVLIISGPCLETALIPNVFSPNYDGENDVFYIPGVCATDEYLLQIFDRWGKLMFSTTQRHNVWDGRSDSGVPVSAGVYYYVVNVKGEIYKGAVHLLR